MTGHKSALAPFKIMSTQKEISARFYKRRKENDLCPMCGKYSGWLKRNLCHVCGQAIQWENLEEMEDE